MDLHLKDRVILITGSAKGIGKACARVCAEEGARVILCDINEEALAETAKEFADAGDPVAACLAGNVASEESVNAMFKAVEEQFGYLDVLVNNAGITMDKPIVEMTFAEWRKIMSVDLDALFLKEANYITTNSTAVSSWEIGMKLMDEGKVDLTPLMNMEVSLENWKEGFEAAISKRKFKVVLLPDNDFTE